MPSGVHPRPVAQRIRRGLLAHPVSALRAAAMVLRSRELKRLFWLSWEHAIDGDQAERAQRYYAYEALGNLVDRIEFHHEGLNWQAIVDGNVSKSLFIEGGFQDAEISATLAWLGATSRSGQARRHVVVDVGANVGTTTIPLVVAGLRVIAIEPTPSAFEVLSRNVAENGFAGQVTALNIAVGTSDGSARITVPDGDTARAELVTNTGRHGAHTEFWSTFDVRVEPLADALTRRGVATDELLLVWSDTQGSEASVVESGRAIWSSGVPLFVEVWPRGLAMHGTRDRFVELVESEFDAFVPSSALLRDGAKAVELPIQEFQKLVRRSRARKCGRAGRATACGFRARGVTDTRPRTIR